jgi:hypothetical protein
VCWKMFQVLGPCHGENFVGRNGELDWDSLQVSECLGPECFKPKGNVFVLQQILLLRNMLNDNPEKQRGRPKTKHTDENCVIVEGLEREDRRVKDWELHSKNQLCRTTHQLEGNTSVPLNSDHPHNFSVVHMFNVHFVVISDMPTYSVEVFWLKLCTHFWSSNIFVVEYRLWSSSCNLCFPVLKFRCDYMVLKLFCRDVSSV